MTDITDIEGQLAILMLKTILADTDIEILNHDLDHLAIIFFCSPLVKQQRPFQTYTVTESTHKCNHIN